MDAARPGDDAHLVVGGRQRRRNVRAVGAQRAPDRTKHVRGGGDLLQPVHQQAAPVGRCEQNDPAELFGRRVGQVAANDETAQRVPHEVDARGIGAAPLDQRPDRRHLIGKGVAARVVVHRYDTIAGPLQTLGQNQHRRPRAPQPVNQHDRLLTRRGPEAAPRQRRQQRKPKQQRPPHVIREAPAARATAHATAAPRRGRSSGARSAIPCPWRLGSPCSGWG